MQIIGSANNIQNLSQNIGSNAVESVAEEGFSFYDLLDMVNPLQHIPIVSDIYQAVSGDEIGGIANVVGGTVFGGPIGGAIALVEEIADEVFGDDEPTSLKPTLSETKDVAAAQNANETYTKMRVTTQDWLNPNFNQTA